MRNHLRDGFVLVALALLQACGGGSSSGGGAGGSVTDYYVDATTGLDAFPGTVGAPFKTITRALSVATSGKTVHVAPGVYDAANGETFPLDVAPGVTVLGDEPNKGDGPSPTLIRGGGVVPPPFPATIVAAVVLRAGGAFAGFRVFNPEMPTLSTAPYGMFVGASGTTIRNNTIRDSAGGGVYVTTGAGSHTIVGNDVLNHGGGPGLNFFSGTGTKVELNRISGNQVGVALSSSAGVDLGGGGLASAGGNTISCNLQNDVYVGAAIAVDAQNNVWDHNPPTSGTGSEDLLTTFGATYNTTGAALSPSACP